MKIAKTTTSKKAVCIVVVQGDYVFLGERLNPNDNYGKLCCPGGKVDGKETPLRAALRELQQETGLEGFKLQPLGTVSLTSQDFGTYVSYGYMTKIPEGINLERKEPKKTGDWQKFPIDSLPHLRDESLLPGTKLFVHTAQQNLSRAKAIEIV